MKGVLFLGFSRATLMKPQIDEKMRECGDEVHEKEVLFFDCIYFPLKI